jgi:hypothetical protein
VRRFVTLGRWKMSRLSHGGHQSYIRTWCDAWRNNPDNGRKKNNVTTFSAGVHVARQNFQEAISAMYVCDSDRPLAKIQ